MLEATRLSFDEPLAVVGRVFLCGPSLGFNGYRLQQTEWKYITLCLGEKKPNCGERSSMTKITIRVERQDAAIQDRCELTRAITREEFDTANFDIAHDVITSMLRQTDEFKRNSDSCRDRLRIGWNLANG